MEASNTLSYNLPMMLATVCECARAWLCVCVCMCVRVPEEPAERYRSVSAQPFPPARP